MANLDDLQNLRKKVARLKEKVERSKGARDETLRRLHEEFGVDTLVDAKVLLKKIIKKENLGKARFSQALEEFNAKWAERLRE